MRFGADGATVATAEHARCRAANLAARSSVRIGLHRQSRARWISSRPDPRPRGEIARLHDAFRALRDALSAEIVGQAALIERLLIALLADGHLLVEGAPGLAKTSAIRALAARLEADFARVQFTPDLLPADLTGTEVWRPQDGRFEFQPGPIFHPICCSPTRSTARPPRCSRRCWRRWASARSPSAAHTYPLPPLFLVMATQNPIEQEGTFPLPEAQLDRFLMHVRIGYPEAAAEAEILRLARERAPRVAARRAAAAHRAHAAGRCLRRARRGARPARRAAGGALSDRTRARLARCRSATTPALARRIAWGASPRGSIALERCARAHAWLAGRDFVTPDDVRAIAPDVLRHRVLPSYEATAEGWDGERLVARTAAAGAVALSMPRDPCNRRCASADGIAPDAATELIALRGACAAVATRGAGRHGVSGHALSPLRGRGMEYAESREYVDRRRRAPYRLAPHRAHRPRRTPSCSRPNANA